MKSLRFASILLILLSCAVCKSSTSPEPKNPPTIVYFFAVPDTIEKGESTTLSWSTFDAETATDLLPGSWSRADVSFIVLEAASGKEQG
jgi:hypothetical protein